MKTCLLLLTLLFFINSSDDEVTHCLVQSSRYGQVEIIALKRNDSTWLLRDLTKGIVTLHGDIDNGQDYQSKSPRWDLKGTDQFAIDAHFCVSTVYSFYKSIFNRNSLDNEGCFIYTYVNDPVNSNNAVWDGHRLRLGVNTATNNSVASIDIIGHELTHGVIAYTCQLSSSGEAGAIGESICDIMGKSAEIWAAKDTICWIIGRKAGLDLRDMANPQNHKQPDYYRDSLNWYDGFNSEKSNHTNSGVGNHMFYLLVSGGIAQLPHKKIKVKGIGINYADQIIYLSFTHYLNPNATYQDWREACLQAAIDLYGKNSAAYVSVKQAWSAVGLN